VPFVSDTFFNHAILAVRERKGRKSFTSSPGVHYDYHLSSFRVELGNQVLSPAEVAVSREMIEVLGTVRPDGSLALDEKVGLPAGRVHVTVRTCHESEKPDLVRLGVLMERVWANQKARGHVPRSREEIDAEMNKLREEADEEMHAVERLHEGCQSAGEQSPEQAE